MANGTETGREIRKMQTVSHLLQSTNQEIRLSILDDSPPPLPTISKKDTTICQEEKITFLEAGKIHKVNSSIESRTGCIKFFRPIDSIRIIFAIVKRLGMESTSEVWRLVD